MTVTVMLYIKAFHIIAIVAWFAGLFYLPRLFVYHAYCQDAIGINRFKIMERRLYYGIMNPAALLSTFLGLLLLTFNVSYYMKAGWLHAKLVLVLGVWVYHFICGKMVNRFALNNNRHSATFYRYFNEVPTLLLIAIVILVVVKPF